MNQIYLINNIVTNPLFHSTLTPAPSRQHAERGLTVLSDWSGKGS